MDIIAALKKEESKLQRQLSAAGRARISLATKARWAKIKAEKAK
ncbi:MAG: hypothetical protein ACRD4Q_04590 [Candidatus Acidiferrales bacterium]